MKRQGIRHAKLLSFGLSVLLHAWSICLIYFFLAYATGCPDTVKAWIDDLAAHFKEIDTNHLVCVASDLWFNIMLYP
jgi:hypothetical protein